MPGRTSGAWRAAHHRSRSGRGDSQRGRHWFASDSAALRRRRREAFAPAGHRRDTGHARRGSEPARPFADPRRVQGQGCVHAQHTGQQPGGQGQHRSGIPVQALRAHEHVAQPAGCLHQVGSLTALRQPGVPRSAPEPGRIRRRPPPFPGVHRQRVQPQSDQPGHRNHHEQPAHGCAVHCAQLPAHR
jgi:hypothetical protein